MTTLRGIGPQTQRSAGNPAARYLEEKVRTASPQELVSMLFDAALANIKLGAASLEQDDRQGAQRRFMKAQEVVMELRASLNADAGDLSRQLDGIYSWVFQHLVTAAVGRDRTSQLAAAHEALRCLEPIVAAWSEATRGTASS